MTIEDDRQAIADLVRLERFHRDRRRWNELAADRPDLLQPFYATAERRLAGEE
jgi:hypothetical protein